MTKVIFFENYPPKNLEIRKFISIFAKNLTHVCRRTLEIPCPHHTITIQ